jgi:hypothetical protein
MEKKMKTKQPEGIVEKFENEVASGGIFDIDGNDITDETFIFIQSQADKTRGKTEKEIIEARQEAYKNGYIKGGTDCLIGQLTADKINKLKNK